MADEIAPVPAAAKKLPPVVLATDHGHEFKTGDVVVTHSGTTVTSEQADEIRTVAQKMGINITVKEA